MTQEFVVTLDARPGTLAELLGYLAKENVNIRGGFGVNVGARDTWHMVVDDDPRATRALQSARAKFETHPVVLAQAADRPGTLLALCDKLAAAGVNLEAIYSLASTKPGFAEVAFRVADTAAAERAIRASSS